MWVEPIQNIQWPNFQKVFSFDPKLRQKYLESDIFVQIFPFYTWILQLNINFNVIDHLLDFELVWKDNWDSKDFNKNDNDFFTQLVRKDDS